MPNISFKEIILNREREKEEKINPSKCSVSFYYENCTLLHGNFSFINDFSLVTNYSKFYCKIVNNCNSTIITPTVGENEIYKRKNYLLNVLSL